MHQDHGDGLEPGEYTQAIFTNNVYENPWITWKDPHFKDLFKFLFCTKSNAAIPDKTMLDQTLPVVKPDFSVFTSPPESGVPHMWIGHASSLVQVDGVSILTDPVFSERCSPVQFAGGAKRYRPPPCTVEELPKIDCVVISHNHYDHLDYNSVIALNSRFGSNLQWYVPMGLKSWMIARGCEKVTELTWWGEESYSGPQGDLRFVCTPCQHWTKRTATDTNKVLWSSWSVLGPRHKFFFSGDTGYCEAFKQIGKRYGPFDLATIPIGAYCPRWFLGPQHVDPAEAVVIHIDVGSKTSVGIHWGTFKMMSKEFYLEPREKLAEEVNKKGLKPDAFITVKHGEVKVL